MAAGGSQPLSESICSEQELLYKAGFAYLVRKEF